MTKFFTKFIIATTVVMACGLSSCSSDDNGDGNEVTNTNPNGGETPATPEQEKAFIEATATELQEILKPEDQEEFVNFCKDFADEFEAFIDDDDYTNYYAVRGIKDLGTAVKNGNPIAVSRAMQEISYSFSNFAGIYEPDFNDNEWVRTGNSNNIEYRFNVKGQKCSLTVAPSNGEWSGSATGYMEEDEYPYDEYPVIFKIAVPRSVKITLVQGSKTYVNGTVNTDYNQKGMTASSNVDVTVANLNIKATADLNNSRCIANASIRVGGTLIAEANGQLNGHDLCNLERIMQIAEYDDDDYDYDDYEDYNSWINNPANIHSLFTTANANVNILSRIFVSGTCSNIGRVAYTFATWDDEDKSEAQKGITILNEYMKANFYLGGSKEPSGDIIWALYRDSYNGWGSSYEWWEAEPVLKFNSDNTTYRLEEYVTSDNFASTLGVFVEIANLYSAFFGL